MTDEQRRRGPAATQVEATGQHVRANVARLRKVRGLTTYQMARRMAKVGRPIPQSGISRIESGARRVDVDDLTALAAVFDVPPSALLLPLDDSAERTVEITGPGTVTADDAWDWMDGRRPLPATNRDRDEQRIEFELYGRPRGRRVNPNDTAYLLRQFREAGVDVDALFRRMYPDLRPDDGDGGT